MSPSLPQLLSSLYASGNPDLDDQEREEVALLCEHAASMVLGDPCLRAEFLLGHARLSLASSLPSELDSTASMHAGSPAHAAARRRLLPLLHGPRIRAQTLDFIEARARLRSAALAAALDAGAAMDQLFVWDAVVVGSGPHAATFCNQLKQLRPRARLLVLESAPGPELASRHFSRGGAYFRINSTLNQPDPGPSFESGLGAKYNHPHVCGPVQMTDLTGCRWPPATLLLALAQVAMYAASVPVLYSQEVIQIAHKRQSAAAGAGWDAAGAGPCYRVRTRGGRSFFASRVVLATGLGRPMLPCRDDGPSAALIDAELARVASSASATPTPSPRPSGSGEPAAAAAAPAAAPVAATPVVMTVAQALEHADPVDPLGEWRQLARLAASSSDGGVSASSGAAGAARAGAASPSGPALWPVVLVGLGNSALTFLEFLHSLGPEEGYHYERVQLGPLPRVFVIGGSHAPQSAAEYQSWARPRYADIASPMKSKLIHIQPGRLVSVRRSGDELQSFVAEYVSPDGERRAVRALRLVLATGYRQSYAHLLPNPGAALEPVLGFPSDAKKAIPIAKRVQGQEIYLVGSMCGQDLVDPEYNVNGRVPIKELGQVEALAFTSVLSQAFGAAVADSLPSASSSTASQAAQPALSASNSLPSPSCTEQPHIFSPSLAASSSASSTPLPSSSSDASSSSFLVPLGETARAALSAALVDGTLRGCDPLTSIKLQLAQLLSPLRIVATSTSSPTSAPTSTTIAPTTDEQSHPTLPQQQQQQQPQPLLLRLEFRAAPQQEGTDINSDSPFGDAAAQAQLLVRLPAPALCDAGWLASRLALLPRLLRCLYCLVHDDLQGVDVTFRIRDGKAVGHSGQATLIHVEEDEPAAASGQAQGPLEAAGAEGALAGTIAPAPLQARSYYLFPPLGEERSTKWHNHMDAAHSGVVEALVRVVHAKVPHAQNKIYPIGSLFLSEQVFSQEFGSVYACLPNFHPIQGASDEAFTTGKMGEDGLDYEHTLATLETISRVSPAMTEIEEDLYEAHHSSGAGAAAGWRVIRDDGDSSSSIDWSLLPGWQQRLITRVPEYELHHSIDLPKTQGEGVPPIELAALSQALGAAGAHAGLFHVGGLFIFRKDGLWAYRTSEFSNATYGECLARLKAQAETLRGVVAHLLAAGAGGGAVHRAGSEGAGLGEGAATPREFESACSLEKVHAIWRF